MKLKITLLIFSLICIYMYGFGQQVEKIMTLRQCIETGIENNLDVQQSGLQLQTAEINWKQARLNLLPNLNGSAGHGTNQGRSIDPFSNAYINQNVSYAGYGLSSSVLLFNGFTAQNTVKQNALNYQAVKMDWQQAKDNLTINIILAYLQVLTNQELLSQYEKQADLSKKQVERLEILNKEGNVSPPLLYDLKGQYASDQLAIAGSQNALQTSKINLFRQMNVLYDRNATFEKLDAESFFLKEETAPDKIYQKALQDFALVKAADIRTQSAEKTVKVAKGQLYPYLTLNGNANTNYSSAAFTNIFLDSAEFTSSDYVIVNGSQVPVVRKQSNFAAQKIRYTNQLSNNLYTTISLNLTVPIFNSWQARNRIKLAQINVKNSEFSAKTVKTQLQQSIEQAYTNFTTAANRYHISLEQVQAYTESYRAAEVRFNNGVGNSVDFLTAKNNLDKANINLISSKYEYMLNGKILDYYQDKL